MPDLESQLREAAPLIAPVPLELAGRIWGALVNDVPDLGAGLPEPRVVIDDDDADDDDDEATGRRLAVVGLVLAMAATIVLVLLLPDGRGDREQRPAGSTTVPTTSTPEAEWRAAGVGAIADPSSCPHREMGACFDPFPAGRYTFHTSRPQVTLAVGRGWTNDAATSDLTAVHSAHGWITVAMDGAVGEVDPANPCFARAVPGVPATWSAIVGWFQANPDLIVTNVREGTVGEQPGTTFDVRPRPGLRPPTCATALHGVHALVPTRRSGGWEVTLRPGDRARITIAATHAGGTVALIVQAHGDQAAFAAFAAQAQHVVNSITFAPCALHAPGAQPCEPWPPPAGSP